MKKIALFGLVCVLSSGCGRGWLPLHRGAPCHHGCPAPAVAAPAANCAGCGTSTGYAPYDGEIVGSSVIGSGALLDSGYYQEGIPLQTVPQ
ncbi:MAG: hypothetical protein KDB22_21690 [Planctomycetales bacterium]|nr:hypothetical protein [Planctomycetales bacterium]